MGIQKFIIHIILTIESFFLSFFKIKKKKISFISLESDSLQSDFKLIYEKLDKQEFDVHLCLIHYQKNLLGQFLYLLNCLKQLYLVYTSALIVLHDNNFVVSHYKRKGVQVLQIWHACGAIKKFGNVIDRQYMIANYDYVLSTSSFWKEPYSQAFGVSKEHILPVGMPRCDHLFNNEYIENMRENLLNKYPTLNGKKIILYAPTFRGNIYNGFSSIDFDAKSLLDNLGEEYVLLYKFHPLLGNYQLDKDERIYNMNHEETHDLFTISDYLISDYSSIVFDYMILEKPLIFYTPDLKEYIYDLGVFVDIEKLGCPVCYNIEKICEVIMSDQCNQEEMRRLKNQFFDILDDQSTQRVVELIRKMISDK